MRYPVTLSSFAFMTSIALAGTSSHADSPFQSGKLLVTGGASQVEGAGGGGLTTWALITGYGTEDGIGANTHGTLVATNDFTLRSAGAAVGFYDRFEISYSEQWFDTGTAGGRLGLGNDFEFSQQIWGAKLRLFGDAVYGQDTWLPQVAVGVQHKNASKETILSAVGAADDSGTDYHITATKILLSESLLLNATARLTNANQFGLLGHGGAGKSRSLQMEYSAAYLLDRKWVLAADFRTKPDNLAFAEEENAWAAYVAYFFNKNASLAAGYVDLGDIALQGGQQGLYLSLQIGF
ncbi:MAG: DUF3034 family protein [Kordiimonadaceae bacterium]|nr:DUF3034 family protein [Kordiimonadaceae bacterium]MBO6568629.1 DUF3034 family protein [Kordiimonadaceae bacterium]MBO6965395.1 DUF3034 family protein [Kordiimonadaceae bacterium]